MEYCKKCIFYDEEYDNMRQGDDDLVFVEIKQKEKHYCRMYDTNIPNEIISKKSKCKYHTEDFLT